MMDESNTQPASAKATQDAPSSPLLNAEWLASLSHELRGPLTAIQGYASVLLRHDASISPEERQDFLRAIMKGGNYIASVFDRFLDIANLEAGTIQLQPLPIDIAQLVQDVLLVKQREYPDNTITFLLQPKRDAALLSDQRSFVIQADSSLLRKMLSQLIDNAQKYSTAHTPIEVTLSYLTLNESPMPISDWIAAQNPAPDQCFVELSIQDHGIGIPSADHKRIFERFERVDMQLTREVSGLGLGLTLCKYIIELHHGAIWVESTPGKGSTFHVLFPI